jgi:sugar/nucleoside kinase (ribokinase family)
MRRMDLLCPTEAELRDAVRDYDDSLNAVVWRLLEATESRNAFVTMGADGLIAFEKLPGAEQEAGWSSRVRGEHVPALSPHALDALGCGDALLATATLAMAAGATGSGSGQTASLTAAAFLASIAAATEAGRLGNEIVSARDLRQGLRRLSESRLSVTTARPGVRLVV